MRLQCLIPRCTSASKDAHRPHCPARLKVASWHGVMHASRGVRIHLDAIRGLDLERHGAPRTAPATGPTRTALKVAAVPPVLAESIEKHTMQLYNMPPGVMLPPIWLHLAVPPQPAAARWRPLTAAAGCLSFGLLPPHGGAMSLFFPRQGCVWLHHCCCQQKKQRRRGGTARRGGQKNSLLGARHKVRGRIGAEAESNAQANGRRAGASRGWGCGQAALEP